MKNLKGLRALVVGLGRFGGGVGVTRYLVLAGARVTVTDLADEVGLAASLRRIDDLEVSLALGGHDESLLDECDLVVINPAVPKDKSGFFQAVRRRRIPWTSEMNLFVEGCPAPILGVTGSAGKSTTTAMLAAILAQDRTTKTWMGGNIGRSLLEDLPEIKPHHRVVLELSSFQLEDLAVLPRSPHLALLTNLAPNHLDRHGTERAYYEAKRNIVRFQGPGDIALLPSTQAEAARWSDGRAGRIVYWDRDEQAGSAFSPRDVALPGPHNLRNAQAAAAAALAAGADRGCVAAGLRSFPGLPHRLELVREYRGVRYYNDSKSTTPDATIVALKSFSARPIVLVGGYDKKIPFDHLAAELMAGAGAVIIFGACRDRIAAALRREDSGGTRLVVAAVSDLAEGVAAARRLARPGDVVLLSPACASYDMFTNYEHRGEAFKQVVNNWG